jgi:hypothetical protein
VRDALAWVLGYTDTAPITWRSIRDPTWQVITTEYLHGRDVHERHPAPEGLTFTYGSAVEDALHWVRGGTTDPPAED